MRIVSLVPSATESLLDWGVVPIACTRFCERPELPHVGGTKDPDVEAIVALRPDLVVMCEEENLRAHHGQLVAAGLRTFVFRVDEVDDVAPQLAELAAQVGSEPSPATLPAPAAMTTARAFVPIWRRPWMTLSAGTYGASLLRRLGVANLFDDAADRYPEVTLDDVATRRPDVVLLPSEPYPFKARHAQELAGIAPAVLVDGRDLFWWGTRTPAALDRLAGVLRLAGVAVPASAAGDVPSAVAAPPGTGGAPSGGSADRTPKRAGDVPSAAETCNRVGPNTGTDGATEPPGRESMSEGDG